MKRRTKIGMLVLVFVLGFSAIALYANIMLQFGPGLVGGVPAYARIETLPNGEVLIHNDGKWAAITFYRDPATVPTDFNLLNFFDAPRAFDSPMTVEGFEIWRNGPSEDAAPIQTVSYGLGAVPIWFVEMSYLEPAVADGSLDMIELESLPTLIKGSAIFFKETLHPANGPAPQTKTQIVAEGLLQNGHSFFFQVEETHNQLKHVTIQFN